MKKFVRIVLVAVLGFVFGGTAGAVVTGGTVPPTACSGNC
jgi:hypothetical protein